MYDVLVAGAGPAGSTAAKILAEKGMRVLLAEKEKLPRYKSCSGQLIGKTLELTKAYFGEPVPLSVTCEPAQSRGMVLTNDKGRSFRFEQKGLNVWRSAFDHWLVQKAAAAGAEIREETAVLDCREDGGRIKVTLQSAEKVYEESAGYLLDCEGAAGTLKRKLLNIQRPKIVTYQIYCRGSAALDDRFFHAFLQPQFSQYDAWLNWKDRLLVIGTAVKDGQKAAEYHEAFTGYLKREHHLTVDERLGIDRWIMPRVLPGCPVDYGADRILFAGEAAGFLNPMGEGISAAMESGYQAAQAAAAHFDRPQAVLAAYREGTKPLFDYMKRQWHLTAGLSESFGEMRLPQI